MTPSSPSRPALARLTPWVGVFALLAALPAALASGTRVGFKDAFATARGNAFVATADNPSALYYNPAGITQLDGLQLAGNLYRLAVSSDYTGTGVAASMNDDAQSVPSLYFTWKPAESSWAYGFAVYAPFGLSTEWPDNSPLRTFALKNEQTYLTYNFSAAWQVSPSLSLGGSLTYNRVDTDLNRRIGVFSPTDLFRFEGNGDAIGFNLGVLWAANERHSFGLSYSHPTSVTLKGSSVTAPVLPVESAEARFEFPEVLIVGWSFRPTPAWNLEVNLDWTNWNRLNTVTVQKASGATALPFNWESGLFYEFGATRYFTNGWNVSAGYCFTENSTPDSTYTPAVPDSDRHFYSAGVGYRSHRFTADLAWQYADGGTRRVTGSPPSLIGATADGSYRNAINAVSLSLGYKF
ncbi:MAG: outer membrane protein transport protein [Candidatus Didemnitutus sp.]|nr:outer membrane protein transport protein [Candidatus Didemnitutus sp.]